jgi:hypothetical protein
VREWAYAAGMVEFSFAQANPNETTCNRTLIVIQRLSNRYEENGRERKAVHRAA